MTRLFPTVSPSVGYQASDGLNFKHMTQYIRALHTYGVLDEQGAAYLTAFVAATYAQASIGESLRHAWYKSLPGLQAMFRYSP